MNPMLETSPEAGVATEMRTVYVRLRASAAPLVEVFASKAPHAALSECVYMAQFDGTYDADVKTILDKIHLAYQQKAATITLETSGSLILR